MAKRWVIKLGSGLLTRKDGKVDRVQIGRIADQVAGLMKKGIEVVVVSSGAVSAGMTAMNLEKRPKDARELQACATVGQPE
jgi:glutamate 5-kinase